MFRGTSVFILFLSLAAPLQAQNPENARAGELYLLSTDGQRQPALHVHTDVSMEISGMTSRVRLQQRFTNDSTEWQEGVYVFPLPEDSAVNRMRMQLSDRELIGEIHEREAATQIYQQARSEGRKAALVEQQRPNLFTQKVANIAPGETVTVELQYIQAIRYDDGHFSLRLPLTLTPRYIPGEALGAVDVQAGGTGWSRPTIEVPDADKITPPYLPAPAINPLTLTVHLQAGLSLASIKSPSHPVISRPLSTANNEYQVALRDNNTGMDRDFILEWEPQVGTAPQAALFSDQVDDKTYVQLMLLPPRVEMAASTLGRELIIILDTSGSMAGTSMVQAKQGVELALGRLQGDDYFNLIEFNSEYNTLFASSVQATAANVQRAVAFVRQLESRGGTEMYPALEHALTAAPVTLNQQRLIKQVVFITDGSVGNEAAIFALIKQHLGETRLFTVGIGSAPNSYFMRKAAETGRGTFTYISDTNQVVANMDLLLRKLENAVMADVDIQWPAGLDVEYYPARVPDLYLGEPLFVTARLNSTLPANSAIVVDGLVGGQRWERQLKLNNSVTGNDIALNDSALASYWARQKIESLLDGLRNGIDAAEVRSDVLGVALPFQLMSPYTSFVATEKRISRPVQQALQSSAVPNQPPQGQTLAAQMAAQSLQLAYPPTATAATLHFVKGLLAALLALLLIYRQLRKEEVRG
ncbi:MAG: marine proteobacterial sortase target protein [Pseudomonadota bacterium]